MRYISLIRSKSKNAFTMMELIFVIVIVGLLATFGVEFMMQAYKNYIFSAINNRLQNESATTVEFISKRLSHRIKDSVMARDLTTGTNANNFVSIQNVTDAGAGGNYTVLEWIGVDIDGWRGASLPYWSGIIDLEADIGQNLLMTSPETNTTAMNDLIISLSDGNSTIADSAIYFIGSNSDINTSYGWTGTQNLNTQTGAMHPITTDANITHLVASGNNLNGVDVYEYYKHAWTAYAIVHSADGNLTLHYNYQPWAGETYDTANVQTQLIMQNVATFQYRAIGSLIKIQVCVESELTGEEYAICKEKTIY